MAKSDKRSEIVRSPRSGLSSMSTASAESILTVLNNYVADARITLIENLDDLKALAARRPDMVFLGTKYIPANPELGLDSKDKIWLSDFLDDYDIWHTGSSQSAYELERDKPLAKQKIVDAGLRTSSFCVVKRGNILKSHSLPVSFPAFVKPTDKGGGFGITSESVVYDIKQLQSKVRQIHDVYSSDALIENYLPGREFSVAILEDNFNDYQVLPIELVAPIDDRGGRLLSGSVKSANSEIVTTVDDTELNEKISSFALDVFEALGASNYGRIDLRLDEYGEPCFLEANLMPSLISGYGSFPKACLLNAGIEFESMILKILAQGMFEQDEEFNEMSLVT